MERVCDIILRLGFRASGLGFGVEGFRVWSLRLLVSGLGFRVWGLGFGVSGLGLRVQAFPAAALIGSCSGINRGFHWVFGLLLVTPLQCKVVLC